MFLISPARSTYRRTSFRPPHPLISSPPGRLDRMRIAERTNIYWWTYFQMRMNRAIPYSINAILGNIGGSDSTSAIDPSKTPSNQAEVCLWKYPTLTRQKHFRWPSVNRKMILSDEQHLPISFTIDSIEEESRFDSIYLLGASIHASCENSSLCEFYVFDEFRGRHVGFRISDINQGVTFRWLRHSRDAVRSILLVQPLCRENDHWIL